MASKNSAGLLMYRRNGDELQVLLVHPGGPFWKKKDDGAWTIPKGEIGGDEDQLSAAKREFKEEVGQDPKDPFIELGSVVQKGGKVVAAWAFEGDCDPSQIRSNTFTIEWPPRSGKQAEFPEIDKAGFFSIAEARQKINKAQAMFLEVLVSQVA